MSVCDLSPAGAVILLLLLVLLLLMLWRWRANKDPLPRRARTLVNRTFRRRNADNEVYGVDGTPQASLKNTKNYDYLF